MEPAGDELDSAVGDPGAVESEADNGSVDEAATAARPEETHRFSWRRVTFAAIGVFVLTLGLVTCVELVGGAPLSSLLQANDKHGTSIGGVVHRESRHSPTTPSGGEPTPAPTNVEGSTPSGDASATTSSTPSEPASLGESLSESPTSPASSDPTQKAPPSLPSSRAPSSEPSTTGSVSSSAGS